MDPATLAAAAITASLPYLISLGKEAAKGAAAAAGKSVWEWVKGKLGSDAKDVQDLESDPDDAVNQEALGAALKKYLHKNEGAVEELTSLLRQAGNVSVQGNLVTATRGSVAVGGNVIGSTVSTAGSKPKGRR